MNIINAGTQYRPNQNKADPEFDDGSQYLLNFKDEQELIQKNPMQENAGELYLLIILHLLYIYEIKHSSNNSYICIYVLQNLCVSTYVALWIDDVDE